MKAKPALPERVRLMEGLGGAGTAALALAAETLTEPERRTTLCIGVVLTSRSVPELSPIRHRLGAQMELVFVAMGVLEPNPERHQLCVPTLARLIEVAVLRSAEVPAQCLAVSSEEVL